MPRESKKEKQARIRKEVAKAAVVKAEYIVLGGGRNQQAYLVKELKPATKQHGPVAIVTRLDPRTDVPLHQEVEIVHRRNIPEGVIVPVEAYAV